ncbi:Mucin-associated surface protein (MASP) [Trypanosoma cruzi]|uniref:Mucin-associated surface protein (MASP) n=3 Tax=Trypanosoma cruzi TaxID=5693 RepID=A0A2V2WK81_TRYCR|nr:Mucin-associated surface protein (MASP) [Trypanosoma cruzi]
MAMMAGRVLLVCALCVLWCGAAAVMCDGGAEMQGVEGSGGSQHVSGDPDGRGGQGETEVPFPPESDTVIKSLGVGDGRDPKQLNGVVVTPPTNPDRKEEEREKEKSKEEKVVAEQTENTVIPKEDEKISQLKSMSEDEGETAPLAAEETPPASTGVTSTAQNGNSPEDLTAIPGKERVLPEDHSDQPQGGKNPADGLAAKMSREKGEAPEAPPSPLAKNEKHEVDLKATTNNEKDSLENGVSVKKTEVLLEDKGVTSNLRKEGLASTTGNQESDPSNSHAESTPPSNSGASNASNDDADTDTNEEILNNDSAAGGAATEGAHQGENKDANTKETTPLRSAAMINETTPTGDSDGSTAVSHTTSPLLLLLVVACAAAAAVVAA